MDLYSYVVAYDSGFAPNPFHGFCTLATCKPRIRSSAKVGDWVIGCGSADRTKKQGGLLVHAMCISEIMTFDEYNNDSRFQVKKPNLYGSRKQVRGDNIYQTVNGEWIQKNSYHSKSNGDANPDHINRDTAVDRVLISDNFRYFGKGGPAIPNYLGKDNRSLCHRGRNHSKFLNSNANDKVLINNFRDWFNTLGDIGFRGHPFDWSDNQ